MKKLLILLPVLIFMLAALAAPAFCAEADTKSKEKEDDCTAYIAGIVGKGEYRVKDDDEWTEVELDMCLYIGDQVRTQKDSALALKFGENIESRVNQLSIFTVRAVDEKGKKPNQIDLKKGEAWAKVNKVDKKENITFEIRTPSATSGVRGTEFNVSVDEEGKSTVHVLEGVVSVFNEFGEVLAEAGFATEILKGKIPLDPAAFDLDAYKEKLNAWKDQISIGAVKEKLLEKVNEIKDGVQDKVKDKVKIPKF